MTITPVRTLALAALAFVGSVSAPWPKPAEAQEPAPLSQPASADTVVLSLAEARRLALRQNPAFLAEREARDVARGETRQARVYPFNPELEIEAPGASTGAKAESEFRLFQEVEWAGQRGLRMRAAEAGFTQAEHVVRDAARLTTADVSRAFYAALAARQRLRVAEEVLALNRQLLEAVRIQAREGEISTLEANLAEIEVGRAEARVLAARRQAATAQLELQRLTGMPPAQPIRLETEVPAPPDPSSLNADSLMQAALARRPDLAARTAAIEQARTRGRLARREAVPNLRVGALGMRDDVSGDPRVGFGVSLRVPLWNRNQGVVAQREAEARRSAFERAATELRVRTDVANAYRTYLAATEEADVFERNVLRPARENQRLLETAYREGKIGLPSVLLLRNQLLDAELGYWEAWLARREALTELEAATAALPADAAGADDER